MIIQKELYEISEKLKIQASVLDKDWILGHFLNAMFELEDIRNNFVFKGGTCLKKCYFHDYRYSEDLDFTLLDKNLPVNKSLIERVISIAEQYSGAGFHLKQIKPRLHMDIPQGYEVTVVFWGADHKPNQAVLPVGRWQTKIKIDISFSEKILLKPEQRRIFHPYSDNETIRNSIPVYPINEIAAEKLRALMQRNRPRDIYDLYFLSEKIDKKEYPAINKLLRKKSNDKNIECCHFENFVNPIKARKNKRAWDNSLGHHLAIDKLIDFDLAYNTVSDFVSNIILN